MSLCLRFPPVLGESLLAHLRSAPEQVAFLRGGRASDQGAFEIADMLQLAPKDLDYNSIHVDLTDQARQRVLSWATESGDILVEAHSHGRLGDPAAFSWIDVDGLNEWVPHVRWRLGNRPYAALVFGAETFDGLAWLDDRPPILLARIEIGATTLEATGRSLRRLRARHV